MNNKYSQKISLVIVILFTVTQVAVFNHYFKFLQ